MRVHERNRGTILVIVLILAVVISVFCMASLMMSASESKGANRAVLGDQALFAAESGIQDEMQDLNDLTAKASLSSPFATIDALSGTTTMTLLPLTSDGINIAQYTVTIDCVTKVDSYDRDVQVTSTAWVPSFTQPNAVSRKITAIVRLSLGRSQVFDYVYFINNWGWFYGNNIKANGNVRANGQFDFGGYTPTINGYPRYNGVTSAGTYGTLLDAGGVYSGWNIINASKIKGTTIGSSNQFTYTNNVPMPNLTDMTVYEGLAKSNTSTVYVNGVKMCDAVYGDGTGETGNLYLDGTDKPITLNGPVVVRGNLIIKGKISGKGAFYVQGNIYVAGNIQYNQALSGPPAGNQSAMSTWVVNNQTADALGLFSRKSIIVGDYTNSNWQSNVGNWVTDASNDSDEDSGSDGIPNTRNGKDGIAGTADDDVFDGDNKFEVNNYTTADQTAGKIPAGKKVGDVIAGSVEDTDGDGAYTGPVTLSTLDATPVSLITANWGGNFPAGVTSAKNYKDLCKDGTSINRLDGVYYTNHTFAMYSSGSPTFNGALVSRNEDIIAGGGGTGITFNYDLRLQQQNDPFSTSMALPMTWNPPQLIMWRSN